MRFKFGAIIGIMIGGAAAFYLDRDPHIGPLIDENWPLEAEHLPDRDIDSVTISPPIWREQLGPNILSRLNVNACFMRDQALVDAPPSWLQRPELTGQNLGKTPRYPPPNLADYPGLVKLEIIRSSEGRNREHCAGARIGENWIVTAAHCVINGPASVQPNDMIIIQPRLDVHEADTRITPVDSAFCHGAYNHESRKFDDDIALLYVKDSANLEGIAIVNIDTPDDDLQQDRFLQTRIAGWGKNGQNRFLQGGKVNLTNIGQTLMMSENIGPLGPCVGDSGGPLYVNAKGTEPLVGGILQSVTRGSCPADNNAFFLRLESYAGWIDRLIGMCDKDGAFVC